MGSESIAHETEWPIDSEPIRAREIIILCICFEFFNVIIFWVYFSTLFFFWLCMQNQPLHERDSVTIDLFGRWQTEKYKPPPAKDVSRI